MQDNPKVLDLHALAARLKDLRADGKRIVQCHGVFDVLHIGHIRHFEEARRQGDLLVVTLTPDEFVNKGPNRPAFPQNIRLETLASLSVVDFVALNQGPVSVPAIRLLKPNVYAKGEDYKDATKDITGGILSETEAVESVGGKVYFTKDIVFSSSALLNQHFPVFDAATEAYLEQFRKTHSADEILEWLDRASGLRPMVIGEPIIDEYLLCEGIGKSTKDPVLAVLEHSVESYAGGTLAVANHLSGLCREVTLVAQLGEKNRREDFVSQALRSNVRADLLTRTGAPTIHKRRILDRYSGNKLLEIYSMDDGQTDKRDEEQLLAAVTRGIESADLIIVADYGHGMMTPHAIQALCDSKQFLAVNVQSNAGNRGLNPVSKYRRANYVCLAMHEIATEMRHRIRDLRSAVLQVISRIECSKITVTRGKSGSLHYDATLGFYEAPALATRVLDRVGAGDSVLAVTSLLVRLGAPWDIVAFVGNVAGAQLVAELGNRSPLHRVPLSKHISSLMK